MSDTIWPTTPATTIHGDNDPRHPLFRGPVTHTYDDDARYDAAHQLLRDKGCAVNAVVGSHGEAGHITTDPAGSEELLWGMLVGDSWSSVENGMNLGAQPPARDGGGIGR